MKLLLLHQKLHWVEVQRLCTTLKMELIKESFFLNRQELSITMYGQRVHNGLLITRMDKFMVATRHLLCM